MPCRFSLGLLLGCVATAQAGAQPAPSTAPVTRAQGAFATGRHPNLMAEAGHSEAEIQARLNSAFEQLFHGDKQTQAIYYEAGRNSDGPLAYITDVANHDVRTEGMSYGMMAAVQMNRKAEFDAIWNWANTYMLITDPANPSAGYYAWSMNSDGTPRSDGPAPDGEEYFAMSLLFAAHRWGNGSGLYDYQAQAERILRIMRHHPVVTATGPFRIHPADPPFVPRGRDGKPFPPRSTTVGPMVDEAHSMIVFVPSAGGNTFSDPSYHLPHFYQLWAMWGPPEDREFWRRAATVSRNYFVAVTGPNTGLSADYTNFDGSPHRTPFNPHSADFSYDSWRTASNWAVDQAWFEANPNAQVLSDRIQSFLTSQGIHTFADQYTLSGTPLSTRHSPGMVATTATSGLAASHTAARAAFLAELWNTSVPSGEQRYYDGLLYFISMLHTTGNFRIWMPDASGK
ncbi:glycosyl hydrolase family 8 [Terriglobus aquaticus]|nr:glycosyl hydrolase family 8 [Terriglobus aquaticus]